MKDKFHETKLDEYPYPDPKSDLSYFEALGYRKGDMLPLSHDHALELAERGFSIYSYLFGDSMVPLSGKEDVANHDIGGMYAVPRVEWESSPDFKQAVADRMSRQEERENAFINHSGDCFAIYDLRSDDAVLNLPYEPLPGQGVDKKFYELVYTAELPTGATLDSLWEKFNTDRPPDYPRQGMSVSDIIAVKENGTISCFYCDLLAFTKLHGFLPRETPAKDAGQQERKSVLADLKTRTTVESTERKQPHKQTERDER